MRSRYTAFALGAEDHLFRTWHPGTRPADTTVDPDTRWAGLQVDSVAAGGPEDEHGIASIMATRASLSTDGADGAAGGEEAGGEAGAAESEGE